MSQLNHLIFHIASVTPDYAGDGFPPVSAHRIVSVASCLLTQEGPANSANVHFDANTLVPKKVKERDLVRSFFASVTEGRKLVSAFSSIYSIPVLIYRALYHAVPEASNFFRQRAFYDNPFEGHIDLAFILSNGGAVNGPNFNELAQTMALPPFKRSDVSESFRKGELAPIEAQLGLDVLVLTLSFLRFSYVSGDLPLDSYQEVGKKVLKEFAGDIALCRDYLNRMSPKKFFCVGS